MLAQLLLMQIGGDIYHFGQHVRRSFGLASPNYAGALLACVSASAATLPLCFDKRAKLYSRLYFWMGAVISVVSASLIAQTYSRGAACGMLLGFAFVLAVAFRTAAFQDRRGVFITIFLSVVGVAVCGILGGFWERAAPGFVTQDDSVIHRLVVWKGAVRAISDKPLTGWGFAKSGNVYSDFYQQLNDRVHHNTPVNGLLTVGMELGVFALAIVFFAALHPAISLLCKPYRAGRPFYELPVAACCVVVCGCNVFSTLGLGVVFPLLYALLVAVSFKMMVVDFAMARWLPIAISGSLAATIVISILTTGVILQRGHWMVRDLNDGRVTLVRGPQLGFEGTPSRGVHALFLQDPGIASDRMIRDVRLFLDSNPIITSCEIRTANPKARLDLNQSNYKIVVATGEWIPLIADCRDILNSALIIVYPNLEPNDCGFMSNHDREKHRLVEVILPAVDLDGVAGAWTAYANASGALVKIGDYRNHTLPQL